MAPPGLILSQFFLFFLIVLAGLERLMLHRTTKLQLAKDGKNKAFSSYDLYDHADRTSFSKLRNCFVLTHCFQIISNCVVAKTV